MAFLLFFNLSQTDKHRFNQFYCASQQKPWQNSLDSKRVSKLSQAVKEYVLETALGGMLLKISSTQRWPYCVLDFKKHYFGTSVSHLARIWNTNHLPVFHYWKDLTLIVLRGVFFVFCFLGVFFEEKIKTSAFFLKYYRYESKQHNPKIYELFMYCTGICPWIVLTRANSMLFNVFGC